MTLSTYSIYLIYFYDNPLQPLVTFIYLENLGEDENIKSMSNITIKFNNLILIMPS